MKKVKTSVRRILSFVLSVVMVCAVVNMPSIAKAQSYNTDSVSMGTVFWPGDVITVPENTYINVVYKIDGQDTISQFPETVWANTDPENVIQHNDGTKYYKTSFTFPSWPDDSLANKSYFYSVNNGVTIKYGYLSTDDSFHDPSEIGSDEYARVLEIQVTLTEGFKLNIKQSADSTKEYLVASNGNLNPGITVTDYTNTDPNNTLIGFWTSANFDAYAADTNAIFIPVTADTTSISSEYYTALSALAQSNNGVVNLNPVYKYEETTLEVSATNYYVQADPANLPAIADIIDITETNRPDEDKVFTVKYYEKASADDTTFTNLVDVGTATGPNVAGQYRAEVIMDAVENVTTEVNGITKITKRGYTAITESCTLTVNSSTASINTAPEAKNPTYNGAEQNLVYEGTALEGSKIVYGFSATGDFTDTIPAKKDAGNYDVYYKAIPDGSNAGITQESAVGGPINVTIEKKTVGITWSETTDYDYDGNEKCPTATLTGVVEGDACEVTVTGASSETGTHTATAALSNTNYVIPDDQKTKDFSITDRRAASISVSGKDGLVYNGSSQTLATLDMVEGGTAYYSLDGENYSTDIPSATGAGTYTVYYYAAGSGTRGNSSVGSVNVTISPKTVELAWGDTDFIYDGQEHCPSVEIKGILGSDTCTASVTGSATEIGTYTAKVNSLSNSNYGLPSDPTITFKILDPNTKPATVIARPSGKTLTYDGTSQKLINPGKAADGFMVYSLGGENGPWSETIPEGRNAREYKVWYKAKCDGVNGLVDSSPSYVTVTIQAKEVSVSWSNAKFTYDKKEHCPDATISGVVSGDSCGLSVSGGQVGAGTYTVKATGVTNSNYKLSDSSSVVMTILPKEIGISWKDTEFFYDGKTHCPVAVATGLCEGDSCGVNVSGAQREIGTYTAKVESITNSNYKLASDSTVEFQILDPNKLKGDISVSMQGYIYGGTPTTPQIKSKTHDIKTAKIAYKVKGNPDATYKETAPREVGEYIVRVTLPETEEYNAVVATATFSITYLPMPSNAYQLTGTLGNGDWYTSNITITPATGYEISIGDRFHFSSGPVKIDDSVIYCDICVKKTSTGEQTEMVTIGPFQIDSQAPTVVGMSNNGLYYADETGGLKVLIKDPNISKVLVDGKEVELTRSSEGTMYFMITPGNRKQVTSFVALDMAGNKTDFSIIVAPYWLLTGEIVEGDLYLEQGNTYKIPDGVGTTWTLDGDASTYYGGIEFTVGEDGEYSFHKN